MNFALAFDRLMQWPYTLISEPKHVSAVQCEASVHPAPAALYWGSALYTTQGDTPRDLYACAHAQVGVSSLSYKTDVIFPFSKLEMRGKSCVKDCIYKVVL